MTLYSLDIERLEELTGPNNTKRTVVLPKDLLERLYEDYQEQKYVIDNLKDNIAELEDELADARYDTYLAEGDR